MLLSSILDACYRPTVLQEAINKLNLNWLKPCQHRTGAKSPGRIITPMHSLYASYYIPKHQIPGFCLYLYSNIIVLSFVTIATNLNLVVRVWYYLNITRTDTESLCSAHAQHSRRHIWKVKTASAATPRTTMSIFSLSPLRDTPNRTRRMTEVYCPETNSIFTVFVSHAFTISPKLSWRMYSKPGTAFTSTKIIW